MTTAIPPLTFDIPLNLARGLNNRGHWTVTARKAKQERELTHWVTASELRRSGFVLTRQMTVTMTRISAGTLDDDNLAGACKHVRDGIADAFGVPDNDPRIVWRCQQEKCKRGQHGVRVDIALVCPTCNDTGRVLIDRHVTPDGLVQSEQYGPCPECGGAR